MRTEIYYYGRCEKCGHFISAPISVEFDETQLPKTCSECGAKEIDWTYRSHSYQQQKGKRKKIPWLIVAVLVLAMCTVALLFQIKVSRGYSPEELAIAAESTQSKTAAEILEDFNSAGIKDQTLARIMDSSPWTLRRIKKHQSLPNDSFDATLRGVYTEFLLQDKNKHMFLLSLKVHPGVADQYYAYIDPEKEIEAK